MTDVVEKIRKLLALSESPNEHEAALAMAQANKLLVKHNLSMETINQKESEIQEMVADTSGKIQTWRIGILKAVAKLNFCSFYISKLTDRSKYRAKSTNSFVIVGKQVNVLATKLMNDYLQEAGERLSKQYDSDLRVSFKQGFSEGLVVRLEQLRLKNLNSDCKDLVVTNDYEINQYFEQKGMKLKSVSTRIPRRNVGHSFGLQAANSIALNDQIGAQNGLQAIPRS